MQIELVRRVCEEVHLWIGLPFLVREILHLARHYSVVYTLIGAARRLGPVLKRLFR